MSKKSSPQRVTKENIAELAHWLAARDPALARILQQHGVPPLWQRPAGLATMIRIVLEQQVSLSSAAATFSRLRNELGGPLTARRFLMLNDQRLRELGFSRQKARYCRLLCEQVSTRQFSISGLQRLSDQDARQQITSLVGFGHWSADIYLLMALGRGDILPTGDLALVLGIAEVTGRSFADAEAVVDYARLWQPYRSVATRMIWLAYLAKRGKTL